MLLIISITSFLSSTLAWYFSNNLQISTLPFLEAWWRAVQPNCNKNASIIHVHDVIEDVERKKERKKESKTPEAMEKWKWELPRVGFEPTTLCTCTCVLYMNTTHNSDITCTLRTLHYVTLHYIPSHYNTLHFIK